MFTDTKPIPNPKFQVGDFVTLKPNSRHSYGWTVDTSKKVKPGEGGIGIIYNTCIYEYNKYKDTCNQILWLTIPKVFYEPDVPHTLSPTTLWSDEELILVPTKD